MDKYKKIANVLKWIFVANLIVAILKITFGYKFNINSLTADGFHALTDTASNIIGLIGIKLSAKPADNDHPYGYQKFETIAGLSIGFLLLIIIFNILRGAINSFINPVELVVTTPTIITLIITIFINIFIAVYEYRAGKKLNSDVLISDSLHTKSDIFISSGVLVTLLLLRLDLPKIIDPIFSIIIAVFIFTSCLEIFKMTIGVLVDKKTVDAEYITKIIKESEEGVINIHKIRSRGKMDYIYIDLHIITDPNLTVKEAHDMNHRIESLLALKLDKRVELIAHIEPNERL